MEIPKNTLIYVYNHKIIYKNPKLEYEHILTKGFKNYGRNNY